MSWAGGPRSKSGNRLERPASGMDFLREEDGEKLIHGNAVASGHDVGANGTATDSVAGPATADGPAKDVDVGGVGKEGAIDGRAILERINFGT